MRVGKCLKLGLLFGASIWIWGCSNVTPPLLGLGPSHTNPNPTNMHTVLDEPVDPEPEDMMDWITSSLKAILLPVDSIKVKTIKKINSSTRPTITSFEASPWHFPLHLKVSRSLGEGEKMTKFREAWMRRFSSLDRRPSEGLWPVQIYNWRQFGDQEAILMSSAEGTSLSDLLTPLLSPETEEIQLEQIKKTGWKIGSAIGYMHLHASSNRTSSFEDIHTFTHGDLHSQNIFYEEDLDTHNQWVSVIDYSSGKTDGTIVDVKKDLMELFWFDVSGHPNFNKSKHEQFYDFFELDKNHDVFFELVGFSNLLTAYSRITQYYMALIEGYVSKAPPSMKSEITAYFREKCSNLNDRLFKQFSDHDPDPKTTLFKDLANCAHGNF